MALCHITGTLFIPDGSEAANRRIQFQKLATDVVTDDYAGAVVPEVIATKTDANGDVDVYLVTGYYVGTVLDRRGNRSYTFKATVPDQATANLSDLINSAIPVEPIPAWLQEAWAARDAAEAEADRAEVAADAAADSADDAQDSADAAAASAASLLGLPLVRYDAQALTAGERDQVKANLEAVSYASQALTTAQQTQARSNLGLSSGTTAAQALGIASVVPMSGISNTTLFRVFMQNGEHWAIFGGTGSSPGTSNGNTTWTYGFTFINTPWVVVSNGDATVTGGGQILIGAYAVGGEGFAVTARTSSSGAAHTTAYRFNFIAMGRIS